MSTCNNNKDFDLLLFCPFPRSIKYEGIKRIALSYYSHFEKEGHKPVLVVPVNGDIPPNYRFVSVMSNSHKFCFFLIPIKMIFIAYFYRKKAKKVCVLENSVGMPCLTVLFRAMRYKGEAITHFLCPVQVTNDVLRNFIRYREIQMITHLMLNNFLFAYFFSFLLDKDNLYFVGSDYQKQQLQKLGLRSKVINPYFPKVDYKEATLNTPKKVVRLGYLGHFSSIKGVDLLIRAFEIVSNKYSNLELCIAWSGLGGSGGKVSDMIRRSAFKKNIKLYGIVNPAIFLKKIDLLVLPYKLNSVPSPPAVLHEAITVKTNVLISDVSGLGGVYADQCNHFKTNNLDSLCEQIIKFISNERIKN